MHKFVTYVCSPARHLGLIIWASPARYMSHASASPSIEEKKANAAAARRLATPIKPGPPAPAQGGRRGCGEARRRRGRPREGGRSAAAAALAQRNAAAAMAAAAVLVRDVTDGRG